MVFSLSTSLFDSGPPLFLVNSEKSPSQHRHTHISIAFDVTSNQFQKATLCCCFSAFFLVHLNTLFKWHSAQTNSTKLGMQTLIWWAFHQHPARASKRGARKKARQFLCENVCSHTFRSISDETLNSLILKHLKISILLHLLRLSPSIVFAVVDRLFSCRLLCIFARHLRVVRTYILRKRFRRKESFS